MTHTKTTLLFLFELIGLFWLAGTPLRAQEASPAPLPPLTLTQALRAVPLADSDVVLAVASDSVTLPKDTETPLPDSSLDQCAAAFGYLAISEGNVTAVAPATMTLLNDQPSDPDLTQNINAFQALPELAASLDDSQWQKFTSLSGLGLSDLTTDTQKLLFWAMFPDHMLKAAPQTADGTPPDPQLATDYTADLPSARLRLSQTARLVPPKANGDGMVYTSISPEPPGTTHLVSVRVPHPPRPALYGVPIRAEVPNVLKITDLDLDQLALQTPISLMGLKTVGDLVSRVAQSSKIELYADPHYTSKPLTLLGTAPTASPPKMLRALMLCLTATFRRVGPAYVLTDSLVGNAVYRQIWSDYDNHTHALLDKPWEEARTYLFKNRSAFELPTFGDPIAATPEQEHPDPETGMGHFLPQIPELQKSVPFAKLTSAQQSAARRIVQQYQLDNAEEIAQDASKAITLQGNWRVDPQMRLEALLPSATQPIELSHYPLTMLVWPPDVLWKPMEAWDKAQGTQRPTKQEKPIPELKTLLKKTVRRAVLAAPRTSSEVISLIGTMKTLGLNQLWLYVFTSGQARIPNTPLSAVKTEDLLQAALDATQGTGITVCPVADLLTWGHSAPVAAQGLDLLGENSVEVETRKRLESPEDYGEDAPPLAGMVVSSLAQEVQDDLRALMQKAAVYPKIGGLVWRGMDRSLFCYTSAERLAFLRASHADPWDIASGYTRLDFRLPNWDDTKVDSAVQAEWQKFQAETTLSLLQTLRTQAPKSVPILVESTTSAVGPTWFGTWDNPSHPLPIYRAGWEQDPPTEDIAAITQAKTQSHVALAVVSVSPDDDTLAVAARMQDLLKDSSWDGFVLDIAEGDGGPGIAGLQALAAQNVPSPIPSAK